jgi:hypothetical protein
METIVALSLRSSVRWADDLARWRGAARMAPVAVA